MYLYSYISVVVPVESKMLVIIKTIRYHLHNDTSCVHVPTMKNIIFGIPVV